MNDFKGDDYDFAAGSIHGMRSWGIDDQGRLHGVTHAEVWTPGENVAACKRFTQIPCPNPVAPRDRLPKGSVTAEPKKKRGRRRGQEEALPPWERELLLSFQPPARCGDPACHYGMHIVKSDHRFDPDCECGFWAYDEHTFKPHGDITGIIEGYGKTTIGTRGFRCEKARIVALCRRHGGEPLSLSLWLRLQQLYPDAVFYEDRDAMVSNHGGVLHNWPPVDEGFWTAPVPKSELAQTLTRAWGTLNLRVGP
jgi:hypothetical protein